MGLSGSWKPVRRGPMSSMELTAPLAPSASPLPLLLYYLLACHSHNDLRVAVGSAGTHPSIRFIRAGHGSWRMRYCDCPYRIIHTVYRIFQETKSYRIMASQLRSLGFQHHDTPRPSHVLPPVPSIRATYGAGTRHCATFDINPVS